MQELRQQGSASEGGVPQGVIHELRERAALLEQESRELGDDHPDRAEAIKKELNVIVTVESRQRRSGRFPPSRKWLVLRGSKTCEHPHRSRGAWSCCLVWLPPKVLGRRRRSGECTVHLAAVGARAHEHSPLQQPLR